MNTQTAVRQHLAIPPGADWAQSLADRARAAIVRSARLAVAAGVADARDSVIATTAPGVWVQPPVLQATSRARQGAAFVLVVLLHALLFYVLARIEPEVSEQIATPLQIVMLDAPRAAQDRPAPLISQQRLPEFSLPEPAIHIATEAISAITLASGAVEPVAISVATTGTPKVVSTVEYINEPATKYPPAARALRQRGTVMLRALIDTTGHAAEVSVHRSSGYRILDDAACSAVRNALFKPYTENGRSLPVYVFIPIEFGAA